MRKTFTEQLLLANNPEYVSRPRQEIGTIKEDEQRPNAQPVQPQQKPMSAQVAQKFARGMSPAQRTPETMNAQQQPPKKQQMSFLEKMMAQKNVKEAFGDGTNA